MKRPRGRLQPIGTEKQPFMYNSVKFSTGKDTNLERRFKYLTKRDGLMLFVNPITFDVI